MFLYWLPGSSCFCRQCLVWNSSALVDQLCSSLLCCRLFSSTVPKTNDLICRLSLILRILQNSCNIPCIVSRSRCLFGCTSVVAEWVIRLYGTHEQKVFGTRVPTPSSSIWEKFNKWYGICITSAVYGELTQQWAVTFDCSRYKSSV